MGIILSENSNKKSKINLINNDQQIDPLIEIFDSNPTIYDCDCQIWNVNQQRLLKNRFQIQFTKKKQIRYIQDGEILRRDQGENFNLSSQWLTNLEQIQYLKWFGKYVDGYKKIGKWEIYWRGDILQEIGGYYSNNGQKQGLWNELIKNYSSQAQVFEIGEYYKDLKYGTWNYVYKNNIIGGGSYISQGQKNGKWINLSNRFWKKSQITYSGEYKNGKKVGVWDTLCNGKYIIGGGSYDSENFVKIGKWIELSLDYWEKSQVIYVGEYRYGRKIGAWNILYNGKQIIGGGSYDYMDELKIGKWIELSTDYWERSQVIYFGQYKNGKKVKRWDILYTENSEDYMSDEIFGGLYEEDNHNENITYKQGIWTELSDGFWEGFQLIYKGEYNKGKKIGRWDIFNEEKQKIGGGSYDIRGSIKSGMWIEVSDQYSWGSKVTYFGEYENGKKVGRWDITAWGKQIGGGSYNDKGRMVEIGIKDGRWTEVKEVFGQHSYITYNGEYKNGQKIGRWDIICRKADNKSFQKIGGGSYNDQENQEGPIKIGNWIEFSGFTKYQYITLEGEYKNGKKVGVWNEQTNLRMNYDY
ncbi:unnamed protein product [Paramecium sonneborni]|uniref:Uncharacterized protein n=1 Tax=Paramecium sonneborni TaxID=65129 RepID=A0A8S1RQ90_9CILI|nr:unnamed protein product [Paramecium sonneborni]